MNFKKALHKIILLSIFTLFHLPSYGKLPAFQTDYVKFDMGYDWTCKKFGVDWICHHYSEKGAKPALMLITAKEGKSSDTTEYYKKNPIEDPSAKKFHIKEVLVNRHVWVDSFYKDSILKNMFSRYVATVCCKNTSSKIHILIGFHAHQSNYAHYSNEFMRAIRSLNLDKDMRSALKRIRRQTDDQKQDMVSYLERVLFETDEGDLFTPEERKAPLSLWIFLAFLILIPSGIAFALFHYGRRRSTAMVKRLIKKGIRFIRNSISSFRT